MSADQKVGDSEGMSVLRSCGEIAVAAALSMRDFVREAEAAYMAAQLAAHGGNQSAAARAAGEKIDTFHKKMKRLGLRIEVEKRIHVIRDATRERQ